ncbi:Uncharacterised protein [Moraxella caprae]|uniref:Uncharacterized protein n=1 Tax=Moraxella caprae TaxID=90240 RepID=A0A378QZW0_9GAMM|nr:hypothetical protein [Moraxella caprae]STZ08089.1 Uncharacterised protein [Moraxella caprae]
MSDNFTQLNVMIANIDLKNHLNQLSQQELAYLQIIPPSWMQGLEYSAYLEQLNHLSYLYKNGRIVMAHIVQANRMLFSDDNTHSCPAEIIYDINGKTSIDELSQIAHQLFSLKHNTPDDLELKKYAEHITNERTQLFSRVPKVLTEKELVTTTMFIWRPHLPNGILSIGYFPILISDTHQGIATVLPARFWKNSDLYQDWISYNDMDMSNAFLKMSKVNHIWQEFQDYAKPTAQDFNLLNQMIGNEIDVSEKSVNFLQQCIDTIKEGYKENHIPIKKNKPNFLNKIKSLFGY